MRETLSVRAKVVFYILCLGMYALAYQGGEWVLGRFGPRLHKASHLFVGSEYPAAYSDYLPFTLPKNVTFRHRLEEFDVNYEFNPFGYRGKYPRNIEKPVGTKRVILCGDSFTLGWGNSLEDSFAGILAEKMSAEVINAAYHGGYSPDSYYAYLVREGSKLKPDEVLLILYTENDVKDIEDNIWRATDHRGGATEISTIRLYIGVDGKFILSPDKIPGVPWYYSLPLLNDSRMFLGLAELATHLIGGRAIKAEQIKTGRFQRPLPKEVAWERFNLSIQALSALSHEQGFNLRFVLLPPDPKREDLRDNDHDRIKSALSRYSLLDLKEVLVGEDYFNRDAHLNSLGNRKVGKALLELLGAVDNRDVARQKQ